MYIISTQKGKLGVQEKHVVLAYGRRIGEQYPFICIWSKRRIQNIFASYVAQFSVHYRSHFTTIVSSFLPLTHSFYLGSFICYFVCSLSWKTAPFQLLQHLFLQAKTNPRLTITTTWKSLISTLLLIIIMWLSLLLLSF